MIYLTAFVLGIFSSIHCVGMCGPIALATPIIRDSFFTELLSRLLYNSGRAISYIIIGLIAGSIGTFFYLSGIQQWVSIISGIIILLFVIIPKTNPENWKIINKLSVLKYIRSKIGQLFKKKNFGSILFIGMLNGLLPCGMVYMAVIGALASSNVIQGGLYMLFFALGTWPLMFILTSAWQLIDQNFRTKTRRLLPYFVGLVGIMLIVRGAGLGIPYLSPSFHIENTTMATCK